jgi:2-polyprenyl-3-methyl-5-hydroxy-6-metoxy-1,4-benzoquinol methylase
MDKRLSYSQNDIVERYDKKRFHGRSGEFVNQIELDNICAFLKKYSSYKKTILDMPCGTGRFSQLMKSRGVETIGIDYSEAMIKQTLGKIKIPVARGDLFSLPIKTSSIDCIVTLRFMFHYSSVKGILHELSRVLHNGGIVIFDTFNWSPKANFMFGDKRVFIHRRKKIKETLKEEKLHIIDEKHCFIVSPQVYKALPIRFTKALRSCENLLPSYLKVRSFWCAKKEN